LDFNVIGNLTNISKQMYMYLYTQTYMYFYR